MKPIYAFGELLIDFLNISSATEDGLPIPQWKQYPGGAPANAAVAAAKLGRKVYFVGQVGNDSFGSYLIRAVKHYGINTDYLRTTDSATTPLAFVSLDSQGERSFTFRRTATADLMIQTADLPVPADLETGIWHLCSNTLTEPNIRNTHIALAQAIKSAGHLLSFDINLRKNLWPVGADFKTPIREALKYADIVKVSREELVELFPESPEKALAKHCFNGATQAIFVTDGGQPVVILTPGERQELAAPPVKVVDTTAGGDGFSGGLISYLAANSAETVDWLAACQFALKCGAIAVSRPGAFPSLPTAAEIDDII